MRSVEDILKQSGPSRASDLVRTLISNDVNLTPSAARQRVSRAKHPVRRLSLNLPNKERFLYLDHQLGSSEFIENLLEALETTGSAYGRAIAGLVSRDGAVLSTHFAIASGLPIQNAKGQLRHDVVEQNLERCDIICRSKETDTDTEVIHFYHENGFSAKRSAALLTEDLLLGILRVWLYKTGWSSSKSIALRSPTQVPQYGQFAWDLVGPTYLAGIRNQVDNKPQNGFIVGDIILDRRISLRDLLPYFKKWDCLVAQRRRTRMQPIFIADSFEEDALMELRKRGAFVCIPEILFGEQVAKDLRDIRNTIRNAAAAITTDPNSVFDLLHRVLKIEGASLNLRGVALELMIAHLYKQDGYEIDIRQKIRANELGAAEIDIKARDRREVVSCECKGMAPGVLVGKKELEKWLDTSLPRIKSWMNKQPSLPTKKRFEFYSSTDYTEDAKVLIEETENLHKKQPVKFFNGIEILKKLRAQNMQSLVEIFKEHFKQ